MTLPQSCLLEETDSWKVTAEAVSEQENRTTASITIQSCVNSGAPWLKDVRLQQRQRSSQPSNRTLHGMRENNNSSVLGMMDVKGRTNEEIALVQSFATDGKREKSGHRAVTELN